MMGDRGLVVDDRQVPSRLTEKGFNRREVMVKQKKPQVAACGYSAIIAMLI